MTTFCIPVAFQFEGTVSIEADTEEAAKAIVESGFGMTLSGGLHSSDSRITDWDFDLHPEKRFTA
jgi:hypothetical protein